MAKRLFFFSAIIFSLTLLFLSIHADEGMWPISEIHKLNLRARGLEIDPREVYNPDGLSLIDGIVQVGGCTGSFVSRYGLILTNHHCAYGALQGASTKENDYIKYGEILEKIGEVYAERRKQAENELILAYLRRSVNMVNFGYTAYEAAIELKKKDLERESAYMDRNFPRTKQRLQLTLRNYYEPTDKVILKELLMRAVKLPHDQRIKAVDEIVRETEPEKAVDDFIEHAYSQSTLDEGEVLKEALAKSPEKLKKMKDPFIELAEDLYPTYQKVKEDQKTRKGALDQLYARLIDVKKQFQEKDFVPDANRTLRLTFGRIRGYDPVDAVYYKPITTLDGVIEKTTGKEPFDTPKELMDLFEAKDFGRFEHPELKSVPVCILYDMDTTGGNSGSPVLNARGELVGINFDRAFEATINDFAWSTSYSRSIAVDIRYVLWVTQKFGGVNYLLKEMNINTLD